MSGGSPLTGMIKRLFREPGINADVTWSWSGRLGCRLFGHWPELKRQVVEADAHEYRDYWEGPFVTTGRCVRCGRADVCEKGIVEEH